MSIPPRHPAGRTCGGIVLAPVLLAVSLLLGVRRARRRGGNR